MIIQFRVCRLLSEVGGRWRFSAHGPLANALENKRDKQDKNPPYVQNSTDNFMCSPRFFSSHSGRRLLVDDEV